MNPLDMMIMCANSKMNPKTEESLKKLGFDLGSQIVLPIQGNNYTSRILSFTEEGVFVQFWPLGQDPPHSHMMVPTTAFL